MALPLVTIITPTYNRAHYLPETIESILGQTYPNIEYIVLDDGSTDETPAVLSRYTGRLHWESQPNCGEAETVNRGYRMAHGDLIGVVSSDDLILPTLVEQIVALMRARPDLLVAYPDWQKIDEASQPIGGIYARDFDYTRMLRECICLPGPGALIRREALTVASGRDPQYRYVSDFDFWLRLGLHGSFARLPGLLAQYRVHRGSASLADRGQAMAREYVELFEAFFKSDELPAAVQNMRAESLSTAYYMAGALCLPDAYADARADFARSFSLSPTSYVKSPKRLAYLLSLALPTAIHRPLYARWQAIKRD